MPRRRRCFKSEAVYEIGFRAKKGLPFVAYKVIKLFIRSAIARTQRDEKVIVCHDIWNGSHCHMIVVSKDINKLKSFYEEVQKRITDYLKRLLGLDQLSLWEGYPMVAELADVNAVIGRIAYLYSNPARDGLEDRIELFPGYSSWNDFVACKDRCAASTEVVSPWIRLSSIPKIASRFLKEEEDARIVSLLRKRNSEMESFKRVPNRWCECFGIKEDAVVSEINSKILDKIRVAEADARADRGKRGNSVMGQHELRRQGILGEHSPKKKSRKFFVISSCKDLRRIRILQVKEFCRICEECYRSWVKGDFAVEWPANAFKPPLPTSKGVFLGS